MKKTILALALVASILGFVSKSEAAINYNITGSGGAYNASQAGGTSGYSVLYTESVTSDVRSFTSATFSVNGLRDQGWGDSDWGNGFYLQMFSGASTYTVGSLIASHTPTNATFTATSENLVSMANALASFTEGVPVTIGIAANSVGFLGWELHASSTSFDVGASTANITAAVPEPSQVAASILLIGGIAGFVIVRRRKSASPLIA